MARVNDAWARINVDETDAQRRKRIENELNSLFQAESIAVTPPPKPKPLSAESRWRSLFGIGGGTASDENASNASIAPEEPSAPVYYSRPTLGDVFAGGNSSGSSSNSKLFGRQQIRHATSAPPTPMPSSTDVAKAIEHERAAALRGDAIASSSSASSSSVGPGARFALAKRVSAEQRGEVDPEAWRSLPPCPLKGYSLTDIGLIDLSRLEEETHAAAESNNTNVSDKSIFRKLWPFGNSSSASPLYGTVENPPQAVIVSPADLVTLATEATKFRTATRLIDDSRTISKHHDYVTIGMARSATWMLGAACSMFAYNIIRCFPSTPARRSVLFKYFWTEARGYTQHDMQRLAQKYRVMLIATSPAMLGQISAFALMAFIAIKYRVPADLIQHSPEAQRSKLIDEQDAKAHALARYLWYVYYHHPAYLAHSEAREAVHKT